MVGGGVYEISVQRNGEPAKARISECRKVGGKYRVDSCTGTWVSGGSLLSGGHVVRGTVDGADSGDIGKTIDVRLDGDRAYTTSLRIPVILIAVGLVIAGFGFAALRSRP